MKNTRKQTILILGGGLTGLSIALREAKKGNHAIIIEKENELGGLARSFHYARARNNCTFDIGPHILRSSDTNLMSLVKALTPCHFLESNPAIWKNPGILHDPIIPVISNRNLMLLSQTKRLKVFRELRERKEHMQSVNFSMLDNFEECVKAQIGDVLYEEYFKEYTEKWWGLSPRELSADMAPKNLIVSKEVFYGHISTNFKRARTEVYPLKGGIGAISTALTIKLKQYDASIMTNAKVKSVNIDGDAVKEAVIETPHGETTISCDFLYSTIPITQLASFLGISCNLKYRADICVFIPLKDTDKLFNNKWLYFNDEDIIFSRISEPKLFSGHNAQRGTSLCVELTCFKGDDLWNDKNLPRKVANQLVELGIINEDILEGIRMIRVPHAYPVYVKGYENELSQVRARISEIKKLKVAGRTGAFQFVNMDNCLNQISHE